MKHHIIKETHGTFPTPACTTAALSFLFNLTIRFASLTALATSSVTVPAYAIFYNKCYENIPYVNAQDFVSTNWSKEENKAETTKPTITERLHLL